METWKVIALPAKRAKLGRHSADDSCPFCSLDAGGMLAQAQQTEERTLRGLELAVSGWAAWNVLAKAAAIRN